MEKQFDKNVEKLFKELMSTEACDLAEVIFISKEEKEKFIEKAWNDYGDDITEYIEGIDSIEKYMSMPTPVQEQVVIEAIKANFESIFDKPFDE
jgi:hypothetical protein